MGWFSTDYATLETFIACDIRTEHPVVTACRWTSKERHPALSEEQLRIAAACLNYGRMFVSHAPTQMEVYKRGILGAKGVLEGADEFTFPEWTVEVQAPPGSPANVKDVHVTVWPRVDLGVEVMEDIGEQEFPAPCRKFTCTVQHHGTDSLYAAIRWKFGYEMIFAPAVALIPLSELSLQLDRPAKTTLAKCVDAMNFSFSKSGGDVGADRAAFQAALPILQG